MTQSVGDDIVMLVSLGNENFSNPEKLQGMINLYCTKRSKECKAPMLIVLGDHIHLINLRIQYPNKTIPALQKVLQGLVTAMISNLKDAIRKVQMDKKLPELQYEIASWNDVFLDGDNAMQAERNKTLLMNLYTDKNSETFKRMMDDMTTHQNCHGVWFQSRVKSQGTDVSKLVTELSEYLLVEASLIAKGFKYKGQRYSRALYPAPVDKPRTEGHFCFCTHCLLGKPPPDFWAVLAKVAKLLGGAEGEYLHHLPYQHPETAAPAEPAAEAPVTSTAAPPIATSAVTIPTTGKPSLLELFMPINLTRPLAVVTEVVPLIIEEIKGLLALPCHHKEFQLTVDKARYVAYGHVTRHHWACKTLHMTVRSVLTEADPFVIHEQFKVPISHHDAATLMVRRRNMLTRQER